MESASQKEVLRLEGVMAKGFGIIPKAVMHDPALSLESKAIYAYLCALAGGGQVTFPYRDTILRQLGMAKNTYYRHYNPLVEQGYIKVDRPPDKTAANRYTLVQNPKGAVQAAPEDETGMDRPGKDRPGKDRPGKDRPGKDRLRYRGLKAGGYGMLPRLVMQEETLGVKAKGLYAYFCAYCGGGDCAFPRKDHILYHLQISEPTYYKALGQLKEKGFLEVVQRKEQGRFGVCDYYLNDFPAQQGSAAEPTASCQADSAPHPNICDTAFCDNKIGDAKNLSPKNDDPVLITNPPSNNSSSSSPWGKPAQPDPAMARQSPGGQTEERTWDKTKTLLSAARRWGKGVLPPGEEGERLLQKFLPVFGAKTAGKQIGHLPAYFAASLRAFLAEEALWETLGQQSSRQGSARKASYDLEELERLVR